MNMKKLTIIVALLALVSIVGQAQDVNTCQPTAERILTAAQNHSSDGIDELLAPEFHFSNIKQPTAGKALKQIIAQMPAMKSWELAGSEQDSAGLTLRYTITKLDSTTTEATFLFNAENLVVEANLLRGVKIQTANSAATVKSNASMVSVPIHRHDGLPVVTVSIDGQPCNMLFDTGAPGVILNSKYFDHNISGQVMGSGGHGAVGTGSVSGMRHVKSMDMGGISLNETDIMTSDLSNLEIIGVAVHGILGQSFYKDFDVLFDFKHNAIVLLSPDTTHQWLQNKGYHCQTVQGVQKGHLLAFDCKVGSVPAVLAFDSGAQNNLLSNDWPQLYPSTVKGIKKTQLTGYGDGLASIKKGKTALTLGGRTFKKQQTAFSDVSYFKQSKGIDGLFGCELLAKQKLLISYKRQELIMID